MIDLKMLLDTRELEAFNDKRIMRAVGKALSKAGQTALRDMRSEASKRVRQRKRIKAGVVGRAFRLRRPRVTTVDGMTFALDVRGGPVSLSAYPHRQTKKGVSVEVNRGKRTLIAGAFVATMKSGHRAVLIRRTSARLPLREFLGSRPVDALLHKGEAEAVSARGLASMSATFDRLLPMELEKAKQPGGGG